MRPRLPSILVSCTIALIGSTALWAGTSGLKAFTTETERRLALLEAPWEVTPALLLNQKGTLRTLNQSGRSHQVVGFIYTRCPTTCREMGFEFSQLQTVLKERDLSGQAELLSVSFDSANESPQTLTAYLDRHGADPNVWQALKFPDPELQRQMLEDFGVTVVPDGYGGFVHNAAFHLVEDNQIVGIYDYEDVQAVVSAIAERTGGS